MMIYYTAAPLKHMTNMGMAGSVVSLFIGLVFIAKKVLFNVPLGFTALIVSITFSTSILLFCMGIIGQYMRSMYEILNNKPCYFIQKKLV